MAQWEKIISNSILATTKTCGTRVLRKFYNVKNFEQLFTSNTPLCNGHNYITTQQWCNKGFWLYLIGQPKTQTQINAYIDKFSLGLVVIEYE